MNQPGGTHRFTCWNGLWNRSQAILAVGAEINLPVKLTNSHWQLMIRVLRVLRPFEEATKEASFGDASIGIVIPLVNAIVRQLEDCDQDDEGVRSMKRQLLASISTRFGNIESSKHFVMATVLDPRYKTRCFSSSSKAIAARIMLVEESKECTTSSDKPPSPKRQRLAEQSCEKVSLLGTVEGMMAENEDDVVDNEVECEHESMVLLYLKEPNLPLYTSHPDPVNPEKVIKQRNDPLQYWKTNEHSKPILSKLARKFLCAPPGSVASERLFSTAADIADGKRNRLLSEKVEMLLFLKKNLLLLNFQY